MYYIYIYIMPNNNYKIDFDKNTGEFQFYYKEGQGTGPADEPTAVALFKPSDKPFGKFSIDKLLEILHPHELVRIFRRGLNKIPREAVEHALTTISANPILTPPIRSQQSKYFKLCQEIIVYLDMLKDGFHPMTYTRKLQDLYLFPTLKDFIVKGTFDWPRFSSKPDDSDLHTIETLVYSKIRDTMETQFWKKLKPDGKHDNELNPPFKYDSIISDWGALAAGLYVKSSTETSPITINTFGTYIDSGQIGKGTETNWLEKIGDTIIVTELAMEYFGYTGCSLFARRVSKKKGGNIRTVGDAAFEFNFIIKNGDGCGPPTECSLTSDAADNTYFLGNASKNSKLDTAKSRTLIKLANGKSWGDKFQNIMFVLRALFPDDPSVAMVTGDNVVAISCVLLGNKAFIHTGVQTKMLHGARPPGGTHHAATNYTNVSADEALEIRLHNTLKGILAINKDFENFLVDFKRNNVTQHFELAGQGEQFWFSSEDFGKKFLEACIKDINDYTVYVKWKVEILKDNINELKSLHPTNEDEKIRKRNKIAALQRDIQTLKKQNSVKPFFTMRQHKETIRCIQNVYYTLANNKGEHEGSSASVSMPKSVREAHAKVLSEELGEFTGVGAKFYLYNFCRETLNMTMSRKNFQKISFYDLIRRSDNVQQACSNDSRPLCVRSMGGGGTSRSALLRTQSGGNVLADSFVRVPNPDERITWDKRYIVNEEIITDSMPLFNFEFERHVYPEYFPEHLGEARRSLGDDERMQANYITYDLEERLITGLVNWCKVHDKKKDFFDYLYITSIYQGNIDIDNMHDYIPGNEEKFYEMLDKFCEEMPGISQAMGEQPATLSLPGAAAAEQVAALWASLADADEADDDSDYDKLASEMAANPLSDAYESDDDELASGMDATPTPSSLVDGVDELREVEGSSPLVDAGHELASGMDATPTPSSLVDGVDELREVEGSSPLVDAGPPATPGAPSLSHSATSMAISSSPSKPSPDRRESLSKKLLKRSSAAAVSAAAATEKLIKKQRAAATDSPLSRAETVNDITEMWRALIGGKKTRKNRKIKIRKFSKDKNKKNKKNKKQTKNKKYKKGKPLKKKPKKTRRRRRN